MTKLQKVQHPVLKTDKASHSGQFGIDQGCDLAIFKIVEALCPQWTRAWTNRTYRKINTVSELPGPTGVVPFACFVTWASSPLRRPYRRVTLVWYLAYAWLTIMAHNPLQGI